MGCSIAGCWRLVAWRSIPANGPVTFPLGEGASGLLIYTADGRMAVQLQAANRASFSSTTPLGGDITQQATAYSTFLAYYGSYNVQGDEVIHRVEGSSYPNWAGTTQHRPYVCDGTSLILRTPPSQGPQGVVVNEIEWVRDDIIEEEVT